LRFSGTEPYTSISDEFSKAPGLREVFYGLRKEVLALDPCVSEKFLKLYVAYKAETNFVDVVPRAKRLRLTLNMPFVEIHDPKEHLHKCDRPWRVGQRRYPGEPQFNGGVALRHGSRAPIL
jgi:predicted transport protein